MTSYPLLQSAWYQIMEWRRVTPPGERERFTYRWHLNEQTQRALEREVINDPDRRSPVYDFQALTLFGYPMEFVPEAVGIAFVPQRIECQPGRHSWTFVGAIRSWSWTFPADEAPSTEVEIDTNHLTCRRCGLVKSRRELEEMSSEEFYGRRRPRINTYTSAHPQTQAIDEEFGWVDAHYGQLSDGFDPEPLPWEKND